MSIDRHSDTWTSIAKWADERLARARQELETPGRTERESDLSRGVIAAVKELQKLSVPPPIEKIISPRDDYRP